MSRDELSVLVEDELLIRMSVVDEFEDAGFDVLEAANADEALELRALHPQIEAEFTDIDMPGSIDGLQLAELVQLSRPDMAILTSGYLKIPKNDLPYQFEFVSKPYDVSRVVSHIRGLTIR